MVPTLGGLAALWSLGSSLLALSALSRQVEDQLHAFIHDLLDMN